MVQQGVQNPVVVVGGGPVALLAVLEFHHRGVPVCLVDATFNQPAEELNPELAPLSMEEGLPALYHNSMELWHSASKRLGLPALTTQREFLDIASSEGREALLKEEAMMDALGGKAVFYTQELPPFLNLAALRGAKSWADAMVLVPGIIAMLRQAVRERGIPVHSAQVVAATQMPLTLSLSNGSYVAPSLLVMAGAEAARVLVSDFGWRLPLRPARGHVLTLPPAVPGLDKILLHRLKRGHLFLVPQLSQLWMFYDGLLDPQQATAGRRVDTALAMALRRHIGGLVPALEGTEPQPVVTTRTYWMTPDFHPAYGPWPENKQVIFAVGWQGREAVFAAAVAHEIAAYHAGQGQATPPPAVFAPNRFASGLWESVQTPASLNWQEPQQITQVSMLSPTPEYAQNVQIVGKADAQYASNVKQVEKNITLTTEKATPQLRERIRRPKIQTAPLRKG